MSYFMGIEFGSRGYKLKHIIVSDGEPVEKTSEIMFWVVYDIGGGRLYTPVSKLDMENQTFLVPSQILAAYHDRTRSLIRKTDKGTTVSPFGGIIVQ